MKSSYSNQSLGRGRRRNNVLRILHNSTRGINTEEIRRSVSNFYKDQFGSIIVYKNHIQVFDEENKEVGSFDLESDLELDKIVVYLTESIFGIHHEKKIAGELGAEPVLSPVYLLFDRINLDCYGSLPYAGEYSLWFMDKASSMFIYLRAMARLRKQFKQVSLAQSNKGWDEKRSLTLVRIQWVRSMNEDLEERVRNLYRQILNKSINQKPSTIGIDTCTIMPTIEDALDRRIPETNTIIYAITLTDGKKLCFRNEERDGSEVDMKIFAWSCPLHRYDWAEQGDRLLLDDVDTVLAQQLSPVTPEQREEELRRANNGQSHRLYQQVPEERSQPSEAWTQFFERIDYKERETVLESCARREQRLRAKPLSSIEIEESQKMPADVYNWEKNLKALDSL